MNQGNRERNKNIVEPIEYTDVNAEKMKKKNKKINSKNIHKTNDTKMHGQAYNNNNAVNVNDEKR